MNWDEIGSSLDEYERWCKKPGNRQYQALGSLERYKEFCVRRTLKLVENKKKRFVEDD